LFFRWGIDCNEDEVGVFKCDLEVTGKKKVLVKCFLEDFFESILVNRALVGLPLSDDLLINVVYEKLIKV
jgi:hypothetical protein